MGRERIETDSENHLTCKHAGFCQRSPQHRWKARWHRFHGPAIQQLRHAPFKPRAFIQRGFGAHRAVRGLYFDFTAPSLADSSAALKDAKGKPLQKLTGVTFATESGLVENIVSPAQVHAPHSRAKNKAMLPVPAALPRQVGPRVALEAGVGRLSRSYGWHAAALTQGCRVVQGLFRSWIRQVEPLPEKVHAQQIESPTGRRPCRTGRRWAESLP